MATCCSCGKSGEAMYFICEDCAAQKAATKPRAQQWISVEEKLPECDGQVLCRYHFGDHSDMPFVSVLDYYAGDVMPHFQHTRGIDKMRVTHWMPLPGSPDVADINIGSKTQTNGGRIKGQIKNHRGNVLKAGRLQTWRKL